MKHDYTEMIIAALVADARFKFKKEGRYLRHGICPNCGEKECFVSLDKPGRVQCGRANKCDWSRNTRDLYPELFEVDPVKYQNDPNPNAAADAYMSLNRGFNLEIIQGWYRQGARQINGSYHATLHVELWDGHYWERLISAVGVKANGGRKAMFSHGSQGKIKGRAWMPPGFTFEKNDVIIMTEGIFKSMAWHHAGYKSISGMSAGNLPMQVISENQGKDIIWVLALDNDNAGLLNSEKFARIMADRYPHESFRIAFPPSKQYDWDDLYRQGKLNEKMLKDSLFRGKVKMAPSVTRKAALEYSRHRRGYFHVEFRNELHAFKVEPDTQDKSAPLIINTGVLDETVNFEKFSGWIKNNKKISNTVAQFLYYERDSSNAELAYFFKVPLDGKEWAKLSIEGSLAATPDGWNKVLMSKTEGRNFRGSRNDLHMLQDRWFDGAAKYVRSLQFVGYDKTTKAYVFYDWAVFQGAIMRPNEHDYFETGKTNVKCGSAKRNEDDSRSFLCPEKEFDPSWISAYRTAFDINGMVALSWWLGSLFAEQIRAENGYWPIMEMSGEQGTGKTQIIEFLWRCCGRSEYEGFDPSKSTRVGRARTFMQVSNLPVVLLEGDREGGAKGWDYNELKMLYNGRFGRAIGVKSTGNETIESVFRGSVLIAQNATIQTDSEAVLARIVHVHCTKAHFTQEGERLALKLNKMTTEDLVPFLGHVLKNEKKLFETWKKAFDEIDALWVSENKQVQNRVIHNHAMVAAWSRVLVKLFGKHFNPAWGKELEDYILHRAVDRQQRITEEHQTLTLFWEQFEYLQEYRKDGGGYRNMLDHSRKDDTIAINLQHYQQAVYNHQLSVIPINELKQLLPESKRYKFIQKNHTVKSRIDGYNTVRCWLFKRPEDSLKQGEPEAF